MSNILASAGGGDGFPYIGYSLYLAKTPSAFLQIFDTGHFAILDPRTGHPLRFGQANRAARGAELVASPRRAEAKTTINDVSDITDSEDKLALVGRPASFARIKVQHVAGLRSFWAGVGPAHRVFVVVDAINLKVVFPPLVGTVESTRALTDGDVVSIEGTIKRVPGTQSQVKVTSWGKLDDKDAKALSDRDVYVYAKRVTVLADSREE